MGVNKNIDSTKKIIDIFPNTKAQDLVMTLTPPKQFLQASFDNYVPDMNYESQIYALNFIREFSQEITGKSKKFKFSLRKKMLPNFSGIYLDGGFGVGKTHLLAALWNSVSGDKAFGSFVQYTNLVGAVGFLPLLESLSGFSLLCIDEFELDDPGDTVMMSRLMRELAERGVRLAATSNTLPEALGQDRFAAVDFRREIQGLSQQFENITIDGKDYRHRSFGDFTAPVAGESLDLLFNKLFQQESVTCDDFESILLHLGRVHPSRYVFMLQGIEGVFLERVVVLGDQNIALRFVAFIDCLYDANIYIIYTGIPLSDIFTLEMLSGGYKKKYLRALSRLHFLTGLGNQKLSPSI